uniref:Uncharacterized protein n=1 Tax=Parascaris univalens TaxID=6257 RepID=A0A915A372_PARUN
MPLAAGSTNRSPLPCLETPRCLSKWAHMKFSEAPESTRLQDIPFMVTAQWFV